MLAPEHGIRLRQAIAKCQCAAEETWSRERVGPNMPEKKRLDLITVTAALELTSLVSADPVLKEDNRRLNEEFENGGVQT